MRWVGLSVLLLLLMVAVGWAGVGSGKRDSGDAAVDGLGGRRSGARELSFLDAEEAVSKLSSETALQSGSKLLSRFFKLSAEGLEDHQLSIILFRVFLRKINSRLNNRD
ncbi:hypothetical protein DER46DRAFT_491311 [Fusarium sp. MPI-SDFR-AT-0072]|nr:hypothetical protein DER46DRAFT_491311 [Fusarium sp. MPI-SDFR-AT-0072]